MENEKIYRIVSASGTPALDSDLTRFSDMKIVGVCNLKSDIPLMLAEANPDILIISDNLQGDEDMIELILRQHRTFPDVRIIYLAGTLDSKDMARHDQLGALVISGIYDIQIGKITPNLVRDLILYPKNEASGAFLKTHLLSKKAEVMNAASGFEYEGFGEEEELENQKNKVFLVWSPKPGSGKSFVSANIATAIARYGVGHPKVALIDGDQQNLSIGNIMGVKPDPDRNLKVAMQAVSDIINGECDTEERMRRAEKKVKNSFVRYKGLTNLDILAGSALTPQEVYTLKLEGEHYKKLISIIEDDYDYIIVDLNSSLFHASTYTLMAMCKEIYCVINLDYNNVLNASRYHKSLVSFGVTDKVRYVLNQDVTNDGSGRFGTDKEELNLTAERLEEEVLHLDARIPNLETSIFFNRQLDGKPVVLHKKPYTVSVRLAFLELANRICPIEPKILEELRQRQNAGKISVWEKLCFWKKKTAPVEVMPEEEEMVKSTGEQAPLPVGAFEDGQEEGDGRA